MEYDIKQLIRGVLEKGYLMSLGTHDDGGVWVADVIYIHDEELTLFWMSSPRVRHSQAILKNNHVAGTITVSGPGGDNLGLQIAGIAEKVAGPRYDLAKKHFEKRKKPEPAESEDVLDGDSWYILKPAKIELINEKLFGYKKQLIDLQ